MKKAYITPRVTCCNSALHTSVLDNVASYDIDNSDGSGSEHSQYTDTDDIDEIGTHKRDSSSDDSWGNLW